MLLYWMHNAVLLFVYKIRCFLVYPFACSTVAVMLYNLCAYTLRVLLLHSEKLLGNIISPTTVTRYIIEYFIDSLWLCKLSKRSFLWIKGEISISTQRPFVSCGLFQKHHRFIGGIDFYKKRFSFHKQNLSTNKFFKVIFS